MTANLIFDTETQDRLEVINDMLAGAEVRITELQNEIENIWRKTEECHSCLWSETSWICRECSDAPYLAKEREYEMYVIGIQMEALLREQALAIN